MVAEILADSGKFVHDFDALGPQQGAAADARMFENLGRVQRAGRENDLVPRSRGIIPPRRAPGYARCPFAIG